MRRLLAGLLALTFLGGMALADGLPTKSRVGAPYSAPDDSFRWTGFYLSGGVGGQFLDAGFDWDKPCFQGNTADGECSSNTPRSYNLMDLSGFGNASITGDARIGFDMRLGTSPFLGGVFVGYNFGEAEFSGSRDFRPGRTEPGVYSVHGTLTPTWNVGARIGTILTKDYLVYAGYKYQKAELDTTISYAGTFGGNPGDMSHGFSREIDGHGLIAGIELPLAANLTFGLEYNYTRYDSSSFSAEKSYGLNQRKFTHNVNIDPDVHSVMGRLTLRTNFFGN